MGGGPCRLKQILDSGIAANHAFESMRNTGVVAAAATVGKAAVSLGAFEKFLDCCERFAVACSDLQAEYEQYFPPDEPGG